MIRSYLFVPADDERKLRRAADTAADALILDLEDSVLPEARVDARQLACEFLAGKNDVWVRINPIDSEDAIADLNAVMVSAPAGIVLPKPKSIDAVLRLEKELTRLELESDIDVGSTKILPICTEHPQALFTLNAYVGATKRLSAMSWGAEDLSAALGASRKRDAKGNWLPVYEMARSLCLLAAAAAEVAAVDTVYTDFKDEDGLRHYASNARRDGFSGMLAIHPAQVEAINLAFSPSDEELAYARRIVETFAANPGVGTLGLDGKMIDRPHLVQAKRLLSLGKN